MQGQWKDKKNHFLKDKARIVYKRYNQEQLSEKVVDQICYLDGSTDDLKDEIVKYSIDLKCDVAQYEVSETYVVKNHTMKKCDNCPYNRLNKTRDEAIQNTGPMCYYPGQIESLAKARNVSVNVALKDLSSRQTMYCALDNKELNQVSITKRVLGYYSKQDGCVKDYLTGQPIRGQVSYVWGTEETYVIEKTDVTIKRRNRYWRQPEPDFFLYKELVDGYFFKRFNSMWNSNTKKGYKQIVNKASRRKSKDWAERIKRDPEVFDYEASPKNFDGEKSIKWMVY